MKADLRHRLQIFLDNGQLRHVPTPWQVFQGSLAMAPYVLSPDVTSEPAYRGAGLGHPWLRQPLIASEVGWRHFNIAAGLALSPHALCRHLQFTYHRGMPVWDLQLLNTLPGGLELLEETTQALLQPSTPSERMARRKLGWILLDPDAYLQQFVGPDGWIERSRRLDYPESEEANPRMPGEFVNLVTFLEHCATTYPATWSGCPTIQWPARLVHYFTRWWREAPAM